MEASRQQDILLEALIDIGQELASTTDLAELLDRILRVAREVFRFENAIIRLLDPTGQILQTVASYGYTEEAAAMDIGVGLGVMGKAAQTGRPVLVSDVPASPDYLTGISGARSELAVPLTARDKVIGVFNVESTRSNAFSESDVPPLMILASQAAIAIENARLYDNLRAMSSRYQALSQFNSRILQSANLGIYTVDTELRVTSWNRTIEQMSGLDEEEALGRNLLELFPTLEDEGVGKLIRRVLDTGRAEKLRLSHRNLRGELRFQKRRFSPLKEGDETTGVLVIVEDITEFKRLLEQTIQSEKLAEVGRLSAGIAHEINNPLSVVAYAAQLLQREENLTEFQEELLERVENEVERLKALTGGLLTFSSDRETVRRQVDVNELLGEVLRLVRYELTSRGVELEEDYAPLGRVWADPNKLKQVFINLLLNAAQAMGKGGTIRLASAPLLEQGIEVVIADSGPGIPADVQQRMFEPFFTTKKEGEGTGLGLYICRNIILEHDGKLELESQQGRGASFRIVLPCGRG
ncbi:MAG: GAF domain-containing protein [Desulfuromonadales bacterium]|nr:GAF domain-containing protein [Desulfuromonadales bacterium]NIR33542.1 GAF domain-containing protein [Desulfuromonadales bacterium]NIS41128.1 GAF domain-containing protein [Desulfuromonadales bacterium]